MRHNFHERNIVVPALTPQSISAGATANGTRIVKPGLLGRQLTLIAAFAANAGVTVLTIGVGFSLNNGTSWANVKDKGGSTDLTFTAANTIAGATVLLGTIPLNKARDADFRVEVRTVTGGTATLSVVAVISDLYTVPGTQVDDLLTKLLPV